MQKNILIIILVLGVIGVGIYWILGKDSQDQNQVVNPSPVVTSGENSQEGGEVHGLEAEPAAVKSRKDLASKLSVEEKSIVILKVEEKTWNDGCLGLGGIAESCLQALVPGFRVELLAKGKSYFYRTDKTGESLRQEN